SLNIWFSYFSSLVLFYALNQLNQDRKYKNFFKDAVNEYIEDLYLSCNQIRYLNGLIFEYNKEFNNFKDGLRKKNYWNLLILKNTENTIIELADDFSRYFTDKFLSNLENSSISRNGLQNFTSYLILTNSRHSYLSYRIKKRGEMDDDFQKLFCAYYQHEIKDDIGKLSLFASNIKNDKLKEDTLNKSEDVIKKITEHERNKLYSYVSNMIKKEVGITTLHNATRDISRISNHYIIYLSRDRICNDTEIKNYLEDNGAINIVSSKYGDVLLFASEYNHKSIENFVNNELMNQFTQDCPHLIFIIELTPMSYFKRLHRETELDSIYVKKSNEIDEIYYDKLLNELIILSGKPVYDIIENATIDFFADELSIEEMKSLRYNDEIILSSCTDSSNLSWSKTKLLVNISKDKLSNVLVEKCNFDFDKAASISGSILNNVFLWRKLLYGDDE
ncbi:MAG: hypothetical protein C5S45_02315, partial [Candidatus Methanocomedens sp.]